MTKLYETNYSESVKVDREAGVITGVKILGRVSKNGREYSDKAISEAATLYEGRKVNVDHPSRDKPNSERSFLEGFGELRNVKRENDGVYGDLHFLKSHPAANVVCESAERFPKQFGLSHNADGVTRQDGSKVIVESVTAVVSVDIVGRPATNEGLFESVDEEKDKTVKTTIRKLVESAGGVWKTRFTKLLEEGGEAEMAPTMDAPVEVAAEGSSEDQIKAAFRQAVMAAFDDDKLDSKQTLQKMKEILNAYDKLTGSAASETKEDASGGGAVPESLQVVLRQIQQHNAREEAKALLESAGIDATPSRVKLIADASEANRQTLLEEFKQSAPQTLPSFLGGGKVEKPAFSEPIRESTGGSHTYPKDLKSFVNAVRSR